MLRPRRLPLRIGAFSIGLVGLASVGTGAFLGFRAKALSDSLAGRCQSQNGCDPSSQDLRARASRDVAASAVAFGAGAAAVTTGVLLWLLAPTKKRPQAALSPNIDPHRIAFSFSRTW